MSGIVAILNRCSRVIDKAHLDKLTQRLSSHGPDKIHSWHAASVGLGHAMFRTTDEAAGEEQPLSLDSQVRITADVRIDDRETLIGKLLRQGIAARIESTDASLILKAYEAWGTRCLEHLLGDFAFVIWDAGRQKFFAARDPLGIRPLFYTDTSAALVLSSSFSLLRELVSRSDALNEATIGDYLITDYALDPGSTAFAEVHRLPAAHFLLGGADGTYGLHRYWSPPAPEEIHYQRMSEYLEHFQELFSLAVRDRLRGSNAAVLMSGGLDSTAIAATACTLRKDASTVGKVIAYTSYYDRLMPDEERKYAGLAAQMMGISVTGLRSDDYEIYERTAEHQAFSPQPMNEPFLAISCDQLGQVSKDARFVLSGDGGDELLYQDHLHFLKLVRTLGLRYIFKGVRCHVELAGSLPRLGIRTNMKSILGVKPAHWVPEYPGWIEPAFESQQGLKERWQVYLDDTNPRVPRNGNQFDYFTDPGWQPYFDTYDPDISKSAVELRLPFFDLRLIQYVCSIPTLPWCTDKFLLSAGMKNRLPDAVLKRKKTLIVADPILARMRTKNRHLREYFTPVQSLRDFVDSSKMELDSIAYIENDVWAHIRPLGLNHWLKTIFIHPG